MKDQLRKLHHAYNNDYQPKYRQSPKGDSFIWRWKDIFSKEGKDSDVWQVEILNILITNFLPLALDRQYEDGLFISTAVFGAGIEDEPLANSWYGWWDSETFRDYYQRYHKQSEEVLGTDGLGEQAIVAHALNQRDELYEHFASWPEQDAFLLSVMNNVANE